MMNYTLYKSKSSPHVVVKVGADFYTLMSKTEWQYKDLLKASKCLYSFYDSNDDYDYEGITFFHLSKAQRHYLMEILRALENRERASHEL